MAITNIIDQLIRDEAKRNFPYTDTKGKLTIGVGRNLTDDGISDTEIAFLLNDDVANVSSLLAKGIPWYGPLDAPRQGILINMAFNMGFHGLLGFHDTLAAMSKGDWEAAAIDMENSVWAKEVGDRATRLAEQMRTGVWQ
jgi:lysozyme